MTPEEHAEIRAPRLTREQMADTIDRLVTAVIRGDEFQLHLEAELLDTYGALLDECGRLREVLAAVRAFVESPVMLDEIALGQLRSLLGEDSHAD